MISIINNNCSFKKVKNTYVLKNLTSGEFLNYTLLKINCNADDTEIDVNSLNFNESKIFTDLADGIYHGILTVDDIVTHVYFSTYSYLRNQFITLLSNILCCDCGCTGLDNTTFISKDCKNAIELKDIYKYIISYIYLLKPLETSPNLNTNPFLLGSIENLFYLNKCSINDEICKQYFNNCLEGLSTDIKLNQYQLALIYLSIYFYEKSLIDIEDSTELLYLNNIFKYNKISNCIKKLQINISIIEVQYNDFISNITSPIHLSNIEQKVDFNSFYNISKFLFLFNYLDTTNLTNPSTISKIKFYNTETCITGVKYNGITVIDEQEYDLEALADIDTVIELHSAGSTYNEIIQYGIKNSISNIYTLGGKILIKTL